MFGIGSTEFLVIILVALLVLGPKSLAKVSRTVGKYMGEFRRISTDFQRTLNAEVAEEEREENREAIRKKVEQAKAARAQRQARTAKEASPAPGQNDGAQTGPVLDGEVVPDTQQADNTVQPPKGSPLEAMVEQTAREAAESQTSPTAGKGGQGDRA